MKKVFLLPVLAMIIGIGMSFTTIDFNSDPINDYVHLGGTSWRTIQEVNCGPNQNIDCSVQFGTGGPIYPVYDQMNLSTQKKGNTATPIIINP